MWQVTLAKMVIKVGLYLLEKKRKKEALKQLKESYAYKSTSLTELRLKSVLEDLTEVKEVD